MSDAACEACVVNIGTLQNPVGTLGDPFGACNNCSSFCCGHHGTRDKNVPEMICVECDDDVVLASAAAQTVGVGSAPPDEPTLNQMLHGSRRFWQPPAYWAFSSVNDFIQRRPGYGSNIVEEAIQTASRLGSLEELGIHRPLSKDSKEMIVLAVLITVFLNIPDERLGPLMLRFRQLLVVP
jgi:hypothetical protein